MSGARVVVVGGGISGLCAAWRLGRLAAEHGVRLEVRLLEAAPRAGGVIRTERVDGYLVEGGPDSLVGFKPAAVALCRELGLADELVRVDGGGASIQIVHRGRPLALPRGFLVMAPARPWPLLTSPLFSPAGKLRMAAEWLLPPRPPRGDESVRSFVVRRLGREAFERAAEPIVGGLFTADADRLSLALTMDRFAELERRHGGVIRGLRRRLKAPPPSGPGAADARAMFSLRDGLGRIPERLGECLPAGVVHTGTPVTAIDRDAARGSWRVLAEGLPPQECEGLILACPGHVGAKLLRGIDRGLSDRMERLAYASCATVNLGYRPGQIGRALDSFGFFVPRAAGLPLLACSYVSVKYPERAPADRVLLRAFLGGALHPATMSLDDAGLVALAHRALAPLLRIDGQPLFRHVQRYRRAMPQFDVGYGEHVADLARRARELPGLALAGGVMGGMGVPDCVRLADLAARETFERVASAVRDHEPQLAVERG